MQTTIIVLCIDPCHCGYHRSRFGPGLSLRVELDTVDRVVEARTSLQSSQIGPRRDIWASGCPAFGVEAIGPVQRGPEFGIYAPADVLLHATVTGDFDGISACRAH